MASPSNRADLVCKDCGEINPPKFEICWNCGRGLEDAEAVESPRLAEPQQEQLAAVAAAASEAPAMPTPTWGRWLELIAVVLVTCYPYLLAGLLYERGGQRTIDAEHLLRFVPYYIGMAVVLWVLIRRDTLMPQPKPVGQSNWFEEIVYAFLILLANWCLGMLVMMLTADWHVPKSAHDSNLAFTSDAVRLAYGATLLFSALYEEVLFRVYLQAKLQSLLGGRATLPIVTSAVLFAACHGYSLRGTLRVFATGIGYGVAYQFSRRVPRLVLSHWMHNLVALSMPIR